MDILAKVTDKFKSRKTKEIKDMAAKKKTQEEALREQFRKALNENNNDQVIQAWEGLQELKQENASKERVSLELEEFKQETERKEVIDRINTFYEDVIPKLKEEAAEAMQRIEKAKEEYIDSLKGLNELNLEYYKVTEPHMIKLWSYGIKSEDLIPGAFTAIRSNYIVPHPRNLEIRECDISKKIKSIQ